VKRSNRLVILVGVLLAVLAFVGIVILLNQTTGPGVTEQEVTETVLVATEDIDIGEPVTPDKVEAVDIDPDAVAVTPLRDPSQVGGRPSLFQVPEGAQVTQETIGLLTPESISSQLLPGEKAVTFQVDRITGVDFLIQPGDHIDIVLQGTVSVLQETADSVAARLTDPEAPRRFEVVTGLEAQRTVKTVLQNKRVLYVSATRVQAVEPEPTPGAEPEAEQAAPQIDTVVIVFAGTDQDAEVIKFSQSNLAELGFLTAVLRNAEDEAIEETTGITFDQLVDLYGVLVPGIVEQLNEEQTETPQ
jgi:Flp pilus assembly protein CpaB